MQIDFHSSISRRVKRPVDLPSGLCSAHHGPTLKLMFHIWGQSQLIKQTFCVRNFYSICWTALFFLIGGPVRRPEAARYAIIDNHPTQDSDCQPTMPFIPISETFSTCDALTGQRERRPCGGHAPQRWRARNPCQCMLLNRTQKFSNVP